MSVRDTGVLGVLWAAEQCSVLPPPTTPPKEPFLPPPEFTLYYIYIWLTEGDAFEDIIDKSYEKTGD
jgi:hypothetical protein